MGEHETVQVTPSFLGSPVTLAVSWAAPAASTVSALWMMDTVVPGTVTTTEFETATLSTEVAVMVTDKSPGGNAVGAVYVVAAPLRVLVGETVPHGPGKQDTDQETPLFAGSPVTVAVIFAVVPMGTVLALCVTETVTEGGAVPGTVTVAELDTELLAADVAVIVTAKSLAGDVLGAV